MHIVKVMRDKYMKMLLWLLFIMLTTSDAAKKNKVMITTPLTHHHSYSSPTYNHSHTLTDRAHFDFLTSLARASFLSPNDDYDDRSTSSLLTPQKQAGFLVHFQIGSRKLDQFVIMDTINSLLWINCQPCGAFVTPPAFDPSTSLSYLPQDCSGRAACLSSDLVDIDCHYDPILGKNSTSCSFRASYDADHQVYSSGVLGIEDISFEKSTMEVPLEEVTFGCSHDSNLYGANGVMGLGKSSLSIVTQKIFSTFSYCIGNVSDPAYPHHKLILADSFNGSFASGNWTPIAGGSDNYYFLNLEAIYITDHPLDFDPSVLRRDPNVSSGGMVVDASSTYTFFPQVVYDKFAAAVDTALHSFVKNESFPYKGQSRLCYNGVFNRDLTTFPPVRLHFEERAIMELVTENLFHQVSEENFCFAVLPIDQFYPGSTVSIMGILMQQYFYLGFDLDYGEVAFLRADCSSIG